MPKVIYNRWLPTKGFDAMNLFGILLVRKGCRPDRQLIHHETIHTHQQREMLYLPFFVWYGVEYLVRLCQYRNRMAAYRNISFEREAYDNDHDFNYLQQRRLYSWTTYLKTKKRQ